MDMASERMLVQRLKKAFRPDQTVIITTHRYNVLALVDRLVVIDNGRVVADGPREEILAKLSGNPTPPDRVTQDRAKSFSEALRSVAESTEAERFRPASD
jgi:ABC-type multidrug transport system ATPase subunit